MSDNKRFVKADGTLLDGKEAEQELARFDAENILRELGLKKGTAGLPHSDFMPPGSVAKEDSSTKGLGLRLKSSTEPRTPRGHDATPHPDESPVSDIPEVATQVHQQQTGGSKQTTKRRRSSIIDKAEDAELQKKIADVSTQMNADAQQIWKFSKDVENGVYHFSLDVDSLWKSISEPFSLIHKKINEVTNNTLSYIDTGDRMVQTGLDTIETWRDMTKNIQGGTEALNNIIKDTAGEVTGSSRNLSDQAQSLAESATSVVENPTLNRVADMSGVSLVIKDMSGTVGHLSTTFNSLVDDMSADIQKNITCFSDKLIKAGEDSGLFSFIKEAGHEICELLKKILAIIRFVKEKVKHFLEVFNGLLGKVFAFLGKIVSVIQDVLGLDMELMKEALKNGTVRAADVKAGNASFALSSEVKTKSSSVVSGAKVTAGNLSAEGKVVDNSKSGHIEVAAVDVKAGNADVALMREGKVKRNLAYLKGANINAGNARATLVDDREVDSTVAGASAAEINVGNVEAFGLGRKGTHQHTTAQPSFSAGNVAIGVRRSRGTNIQTGPQFSAFNIDLTIGAPSVTNFLNQLRPGHGFANFTIPFLGGGAGEAGGKSNGEKGNEMPLETAGENTYGLPRDTVEFGDRLPQHDDTRTDAVHSGSNKNGETGTDPVPGSGSGPGPWSSPGGESVSGSGDRDKSTSGTSAGGTGKGTGRSNSQESHPRKSPASNMHNFGTEIGKDSQVSNTPGSGVYLRKSEKKSPKHPKKEKMADDPSTCPDSDPCPGGRGESTLGASAGGTWKGAGSANTQESHSRRSTASNMHNFGTEIGNDSQVSNAPGSGVYKGGDGILKTSNEDNHTTVEPVVRRKIYQKSEKKSPKHPKKEKMADDPSTCPDSDPCPGGRGESTLGASARGTRNGAGCANTQESHSRRSTASNMHNFGTEMGQESQTGKRGQTGQTSHSVSSSNSLLNKTSDCPFPPKQDSRDKQFSESGESKGVSNVLRSGVYKNEQGIGDTSEDDYQTTVASIVRREVYQKSGNKPKQDTKKETRAEEKVKKYSKEELRRILLKECREEIDSSTEAGEGRTGCGKEMKDSKKTDVKPKAKPWGEHGNIHGFSTLGTECGKEVKKLGNGIYGFGDE